MQGKKPLYEVENGVKILNVNKKKEEICTYIQYDRIKIKIKASK